MSESEATHLQAARKYLNQNRLQSVVEAILLHLEAQQQQWERSVEERLAELRELVREQAFQPVQPHQHHYLAPHPGYVGKTQPSSLPIPEPREETPQSGRTSPESQPVSPESPGSSEARTIAWSVETDSTSVLINSRLPHGAALVEAASLIRQALRSRMQELTDSMSPEAPATGPTVSTDEHHAVVLKELRQKIDDGLVPEENDMDRGYNIGLRQVREWIHRLYRDIPETQEGQAGQ